MLPASGCLRRLMSPAKPVRPSQPQSRPPSLSRRALLSAVGEPIDPEKLSGLLLLAITGMDREAINEMTLLAQRVMRPVRVRRGGRCSCWRPACVRCPSAKRKSRYPGAAARAGGSSAPPTATVCVPQAFSIVAMSQEKGVCPRLCMTPNGPFTRSASRIRRPQNARSRGLARACIRARVHTSTRHESPRR